MKKICLILIMHFSYFISNCQVFWTEDFGAGCNQAQLATAYTGTNGVWSSTSIGTNYNSSNTFYISAAERGLPIGSCGAQCGGSNNATLHLGNILLSIPAYTFAPDNGATYFSGGFSFYGDTATTNKRIESPMINCSGKTNITIAFSYMEGGDGTMDDASLWYSSNGGVLWSLLDNMAKTTSTSCSPKGLWTAYSFSLPTSANNNPSVKIGFKWINNDDGFGTDPSFAVDDITLSGSVTTNISDITLLQLQMLSQGKNIIIKSETPVKLISILDILGKKIPSSIEYNIINLENQATGIYFIIVELNGQLLTKKIVIE